MLSLSKFLSKSNALVSMTTAVKTTTRSMTQVIAPSCYSCPRTMLVQRLQRSPVVLEYSYSSSTAVLEATKTGSVKWFDAKKGFGFITPEDGSDDIFVHQSVIHAEGFRSLGEGEPVEFTIVTDMKGRVKADRVTGPMGSFVQGAPRRPFDDYDDNSRGGERRFNGGGGNYGGGSYGGGGGSYGGGRGEMSEDFDPLDEDHKK